MRHTVMAHNGYITEGHTHRRSVDDIFCFVRHYLGQDYTVEDVWEALCQLHDEKKLRAMYCITIQRLVWGTADYVNENMVERWAYAHPSIQPDVDELKEYFKAKHAST